MKQWKPLILILIGTSVLFVFLIKWVNKKFLEISQSKKYKEYITNKIIYNKKDNYFKNIENIKIISQDETFYKPKLNKGMLILFGVFIVFGLILFYINFREKIFFAKFFPLFFSIYGILLYRQYLSTKYILNKKNLSVFFNRKKYIISLKKISEITKEKINMGYKHGINKGRIRAETNSDVLFIKFLDDKNMEQVIMISPLEEEKFINHVLSNLSDDFSENERKNFI